MVFGGRLLESDCSGVPTGEWVATLAGHFAPLAGFVPRFSQRYKVGRADTKVTAFAMNNRAQYPGLCSRRLH